MSLTVVTILAIGLLLLGWYAIVTIYALTTRARDLPAAPASPDLGTEPPAVVNLLVTRCELTADAADATLLDLAARRILELYQPGNDPGAALVRVRVPAPTGLNPYEQRVFDRVQAATHRSQAAVPRELGSSRSLPASAGNQFVPLTDVTRQFADGGPLWFRQLRAEVIADAASRGLVKVRRFGTGVVLLSLLTAIAIACSGVIPVQRDQRDRFAGLIAFASVGGWFCGTLFVWLILIFTAAAIMRAPGHTPAGREVGTRWFGLGRWLTAHPNLADLPPAAVAVWDRYLAYGVALGVNPVASRAVDLRVGRVGRLRSSYTGQPRLVLVRYPRNPFTYTQAGARLLWAAFVLAFWISTGLLLRSAVAHSPAVLRWPAIVIGTFLVLRAAYKVVRSAVAKLFPVTVTGELLALHAWRVPTDGRPRWFQLVVDDGRHDRTWPWLVRADKKGPAEIGDVVQLRAQSWTRHTLALTVLRPAAVPAGPTRWISAPPAA